MLRDTCVPPSRRERETAAPAGPRRGGKQAKNALGSAVAEYHTAGGESNPNLSAALALAKAGFEVFPARQDKKPLVRWKEESSTDPDRIGEWWARWPDAMPALPTGERNGISVLDLDRKNGKDGFAELRRIGLDPEELGTVQVATPSGGRHIYFQHLPGLKNSAGQIGSGIDVRGEGGYVIAPGAVNGSGVYESLIDDLSDQIIGLTAWPAELNAAVHSPRLEMPEPDTQASDHDSAWAQGRLADECAKLRDTEPGARNDTLNRAAFNLGRVAAVGLLDRMEIEFALLAACVRNGLLRDDGRDACRKSIKSGYMKGLSEPKFPPIDPSVAFESASDAETAGGITFMTPTECAGLPPQEYVVKGLIGPGQIGCIFGDPGAGKSLIAPAIGYAVAQGRSTFGMRTRQGEVFYVAAEDATGMQGRVAALRMENDEADSFKLVTGVSDLFTVNAPDLKALRKAVKERRPKLVIVDTLAMAFPGMDENTSEAMGRVVAVARALARHGSAVILIHHGTKAEGNTPRGHSLFNGALDMALHLAAKDQSGIVRGKLRKNRNGSCDLDIAFTIGTRELGTDQDGDTITAAFADELPAGMRPACPKLTKSERGAITVLHRLLDGKSAVAESDWREACISGRDVSGSDTRDNRRRTVSEAIRGLVQKEEVRVSDGQVRWPSLAEAFEDISEDGEDV
jgi:archaellum biogenesis ATPase FlaH